MTMLIARCREAFHRRLESTMTQANNAIVKNREALQKVSNYVVLKANYLITVTLLFSSTLDRMN
jgi:hypothetical protein